MSINDLLKQTNRVEGFYDALKNQETELSDTIASLKKETERDTKVSAVLKHLLDLMVKGEINRTAGLITYGLKTIFDDQDLTFEPEVSQKGGKIHIKLKTINDGIETDFKSSGGSVSVIESFLFRILCVLKKDLARLMFLDETFSAVGDEYIPNTGKFVKELAKKIGIDILLVTHQKEFKHYADNAYKVVKLKGGLTLEKIK